MNFINLNCRMKYATYAVANESPKFLPEYRGRGSIPDKPEVLSRFFWQLIFWSSSLHFLRFLSPTDIKKLFAFFPFSLLKKKNSIRTTFIHKLKLTDLTGGNCEVVRFWTRSNYILDFIVLLASENNCLGEAELRFRWTRSLELEPELTKGDAETKRQNTNLFFHLWPTVRRN